MARCQLWACGHDFGVGEAAHLAADRLEGLVKARIADRAFPRLADQGGEGGAIFPRIAGRDQGLDDCVAKGRHVLKREAEVGRTHDLALVHGYGAEDLSEIFAEPDPGQEPFGLAEAALLAHAPGVGRHFLDRFDIGRKPRQPMHSVLFRFDLAGVRLAVFADPGAYGVKGAIHEALGGEMGFIGEVVESHGGRLCSGRPLLRRNMRRRAHDGNPSFGRRRTRIRPGPGGARRSAGPKCPSLRGRLERGGRTHENRLAGGGEIRRR